MLGRFLTPLVIFSFCAHIAWAHDALSNAPLGKKDFPSTWEARVFLEALALEKSGQIEKAIKGYEALLGSVIADLATERLASIYIERKDTWKARAILSRVDRDSPHFVGLRILLAKCLCDENRCDLAKEVLRDLLERAIDDHENARVRLALADLFMRTNDVKRAVDQAVFVFLHGDDEVLDEAQEQLRRLGIRFGGLEKRLRTAYRATKNFMPEPGFEEDEPAMTRISRGAYYLKVRKDLSRAQKELFRAKDKAESWLARFVAQMLLADALANDGKDDEAIKIYLDEAKSLDNEVLKCIVLLKAARAHVRLARFDEALSILQEVSSAPRYVGLGMEAKWQSALCYLVSKDFSSAYKLLDELWRVVAGEGVLFRFAEKINYFRGVALYGLGKKEEAIHAWRHVARGFPGSYYGLLAVSRLKQLVNDKETETLSNGSKNLSRSALVALDLYSKGLKKEGIALLRERALASKLNEDDLALLVAMLKDAMRTYEALSFAVGAKNIAVLDKILPLGFEEEVGMASEEFQIDRALIFAVISAESNFNPKAKSKMGAVGLMQLLPSSARLVASQIFSKIELARKVWHPRINILLGSALLKDLLVHFRGQTVLALAGYNAGVGAARSFYKRFKRLEADIFVEIMPYQATAQYVKKVLAMFSAYRAMQEGEETTISLDLPQDLGPFLQKREIRKKMY